MPKLIIDGRQPSANILEHLISNTKSTVKIISIIVNNVNSNVTTYC